MSVHTQILRLVVTPGPASGLATVCFIPEQGGSIGSGADSDCLLIGSSRVIAKQHAVIEFRKGGYFLICDSEIGTIVDDGPVLDVGDSVELEHGNIVRIASYQLLVDLESGPVRDDLGPNEVPAEEVSDELFSLDPGKFIGSSRRSSGPEEDVDAAQAPQPPRVQIVETLGGSPSQPPGAPIPDSWCFEEQVLSEDKEPMPQVDADGRLPRVPISGSLVENIPRQMRVDEAEDVEVRIGARDLETLAMELRGRGKPHSHDVLVTKAMSVRLRSTEGYLHVETASPETQWIESQLGDVDNEYASWLFRLTPKQRGKERIQLLVSARLVGHDGLYAESTLPEQIVEVLVQTNYRFVVLKALGWMAALLLGVMLERFGETLFDKVSTIVNIVFGV